MFEVGDIIRHRKYKWWAFVEKVEPLFTDFAEEEPSDFLFKCYRFDCGGYYFTFIGSEANNYIYI